jgi:hypothetical protein
LLGEGHGDLRFGAHLGVDLAADAIGVGGEGGQDLRQRRADVRRL